MENQADTVLHDAKGLARIFGRSVGWVYAAKRRGFVMIGGRSTVAEFRAFLVLVPKPRAGEPRKRVRENTEVRG